MILVILITMGIGIVRSVYTLSQKKGIISERQGVLHGLLAENSRLNEQLLEATSPAFIEQEARDKLGLVRPGETVVIMDRTQNVKTGNQKTPQDLPSWKQWWSLFF